MHHPSENLNYQKRKIFAETDQALFDYYCKKLDEAYNDDLSTSSDYFLSLQHFLEDKSDLKFKLALYHVKNFAVRVHPNIIPEYLYNLLWFFLENKRNEFDNDSDYFLSFCGYFLIEVIELTKKILPLNSFKTVRKIYNIGIEFFGEFGLIENTVLLLLAKGESYLHTQETTSALNCFRNVFKIIFTVYKDPNYHISDDSDIPQLIKALDKICKTEKTTHSIYYQNIFQLLQIYKDSQLSSFENLIDEALAKKDYLVCKDLYYIGSIINKIYSLNEDLIRNPVLAGSLNNKEKFTALLKKLDHETCLFTAIGLDNTEKAMDLITQKISIKDVNEHGLSPLHVAVEKGNTVVVEALIRNGCNVNSFVFSQESIIQPPIFTAIENGNLKMVEILVKGKAKLNLFVEKEHSPLYLAFKKNDKPIAEYLLRHNAKLTPEEENLLRNNVTYLELIGHLGINVSDQLLYDFKNFKSKPSTKNPNHKRHPSPIFCLHPVSGECNIWAKFAEEVGKFPQEDLQRPVLGIMSPGLFSPMRQPNSIEEMASLYIKIIKEKYPTGPYILCGWSFGGLVVFEMARQLIECGEKVCVVGLIDCPAPSAMLNLSKSEFADSLATSLNPCITSFKLNPNCLPSKQILSNLGPEQQITLCTQAIIDDLRKIYKSQELGIQKTLENYCNITNVIKVHLLAALKYDPKIDANSPQIHCYNTSKSIETYKSEDLGWSKHTKKCLPRSYESDHFGIMNVPRIKEVVSSYITHPQMVLIDIVKESVKVANHHRKLEEFLSKISIPEQAQVLEKSGRLSPIDGSKLEKSEVDVDKSAPINGNYTAGFFNTKVKSSRVETFAQIKSSTPPPNL